ncbi:uncharacterized protein IL334_000774 [Kwoniella shivajii]|uniref:Ig-like domain-containing protein n=1 Tax=Kwoniella shivajii TaxID=564305 RepID=A0ABZ1CQ26_9TREE|nr:hypothetical protein IL334_000774 [Kwoniella shivajii]
MPGRFLLRRAQASLSLSTSKKESKSKSPAPERSLSDSSIQLACTTGPSILRSNLNPRWKEKRPEPAWVHDREEEGDHLGDEEVPFELDETLTPSPDHSLLTTPTFSVQSTATMPLEFFSPSSSSSMMSRCECDPECLDPSLCRSYISFGSSYMSQPSSSQIESNELFNSSVLPSPWRQSPCFIDNDNFSSDNSSKCSWANSPSFSLSRSNLNIPSIKIRRQSQDSTYQSEDDFEDDSFDNRGSTLKRKDLSDLLNGCGSLMDSSSVCRSILSDRRNSEESFSSSLSTIEEKDEEPKPKSPEPIKILGFPQHLQPQSATSRSSRLSPIQESA